MLLLPPARTCWLSVHLGTMLTTPNSSSPTAMASSAAAADADHTVSPILPRRTRQRRQSTVDGEEAELGALDLASELPAVSQRAELDKQRAQPRKWAHVKYGHPQAPGYT
jgi:hypothetical protein